jgi:Ferric reductase like transmembrane component
LRASLPYFLSIKEKDKKATEKLNLISFLELQITSWRRIGRVNVAGAISLITILIIWISSLPMIRRKYFQTFYMAHHLYIVFITFFLLHAGDRHFYLVLSGILLFALDKNFRLIQSRREAHIVSASVLPCRAVELILPKDPSKFLILCFTRTLCETSKIYPRYYLQA